MIINKLKLNNFGIYSGEHTFDLKPKRDKNIVLIGGQNGNGKTTFFEAIRLCLYGAKVLDGVFKRKEYEKYLLEKIHNNPLKKVFNDSAYVELEFQYSTLGEIETYRIIRSWKEIKKNVVEEFFNIEKNKKTLDLDPDQWQEFINGLIPPGLSKLFFFDGEKLQNLAGDSKDDHQLGDSFDSLMGIDLAEKLIADLKIYSSKNLKTLSNEDNSKLKELEDQKENFLRSIEVLIYSKAEVKTKIDSINLSIEKVDEKISLEGGSFAVKRDMLEEEKKKLELKSVEAEEQMRELCLGRLPFMFSSDINKSLKKSLTKERESRKKVIFNDTLNEKFSLMREGLANNKKVSDKFSKKEDLDELLGLIESELKVNSKSIDKKQVHSISDEEVQKISFLFDIVESEDKEKFLKLSKEYEIFSKKIHILERQITFAPEESTIKPYLDHINDLNRKLGYYESQIKHLDEEKIKKMFDVEKIKREIKKLEEKAKFKKGLKNKAMIVEKVQKVLGKYNNEFKKLKIEEFTEEFIKSFNFLMRKKDLCNKIEVNPLTYEVTLYNSKNQKIPKRMLSAGEKQIYALSVLWTLTKISKRSLPFIIDTPMGRLDKEHRDSFVLNFLPKAGQQLIILSTNSEIDLEYAKQLKPFLSKKIILKYNDGETKPEEGYFKK